MRVGLGSRFRAGLPRRHSQGMSLDDRTVAVYGALDSVTLLALLPALRSEAERTREEAETFERVRQAIPVQTAAVDLLAETTATKGRRATEPSGSEAPKRGGDDGELARVLEQLDRYREDLLARERWIRTDLVRRGLLPEYPIWGQR
jgi:hypothetical protein